MTELKVSKGCLVRKDVKPGKDRGLEEPMRERVMGRLLGMRRGAGRVEGIEVESKGVTEGGTEEAWRERGEKVGARGEDGGESRMGGRGEGEVGSGK
jgi:hypothetical protein